MAGVVTVRLNDEQMVLLEMTAAKKRCSLAEVLRALVQDLNNTAGNDELIEVWKTYFGARA